MAEQFPQDDRRSYDPDPRAVMLEHFHSDLAYPTWLLAAVATRAQAVYWICHGHPGARPESGWGIEGQCDRCGAFATLTAEGFIQPDVTIDERRTGTAWSCTNCAFVTVDEEYRQKGEA